MKHLLVVILFTGVVLRLAVFSVSPPSNSYDNHLEAVAINMEALKTPIRVDPWDCWECYQPPLYYWVASGVAHLSSFILNDFGTWKLVQSLSFFASCLTLFLTAAALLLVLPRREHRPALYVCLTLFAVLPRAIYSSAMTTNDAFLEASVAIALVGYLTLSRRDNQDGLGLILIMVGTLGGCWVKQSGLILIAPLVILLLITIFGWWKPCVTIAKESVIASLVLVLFLAGTDEAWRYSRTGIFLVSNQQYYSHAITQLPGSLSEISFLSLRIRPLLENVFMEEQTLSSFWTELVARFWFDYERRFFPVNSITLAIGRVAYVFGGFVTFLTAIATAIFVVRKPFNAEKGMLLLLAAGFFATPILQTLRFPYYSSMKAVFALPGLPALLCLAGLGIASGLQLRLLALLTKITIAVALLLGFLHIVFLVAFSSEAWLHGLSGPLWPLPVLR